MVLIQLQQFVEADLRNHVPPKASSSANGFPGLEGGFEEGLGGDDPPFPKSLFLFQPLFMSHELNAVAEQAQAAVGIPDGLYLDRDIVPGGGYPVDLDTDEQQEESEQENEMDLGQGGGKGMEELRRVLREQEAEDKEKRKGKKGKGKGKKDDGEVSSAERLAEKEKVGSKGCESRRKEADALVAESRKEGEGKG